jgi:hypothetical protein
MTLTHSQHSSKFGFGNHQPLVGYAGIDDFKLFGLGIPFFYFVANLVDQALTGR